MRVKYWASAKWVKKLRVKLGAPVPLECGTSSEWRAYTKACKEWNKTLDWLLDDFIDHVQNFVMWPKDKLDSLSYWINNRFILPTHTINTRLTKGQWHETEEKMLHGMFEELVDFVEVQKGTRTYGEDQKFVPWWDRYLPYFLNRLFITRSQHYGVRHLLWEITLIKDGSWFGIDYPGVDIERVTAAYNDPEWMKPTHQAITAMEQLELYVWWKFIRPMRQDPMDASGLTDYYNSKRKDGDDFWDMIDHNHPSDNWRELHDKCNLLEKQYEDEDEQMLIRLIKIRKSLWT